MSPRILLAAAAVAALPMLASAQSFTPGHIVASLGGRLYELDENLQTVRTLQVPLPSNNRFDVVDVVVDPLGRAHVLLTSSFTQGSIATYDPLTNTWTQNRIAAFLGNLSDGDLSILGTRLFTKGLRIDLPDYTTTPIQLAGRGVGEISAGNDGRLFALDSGSPRPGIRIVDPETLTVVESLSVTFVSDLRGIGSLPNGEIVVSDWDGSIKRYSPDATTLLASLQTGVFNFNDVAVRPDGRIAAASRFGTIAVTDASLTSATSVNPAGASLQAYCCFVPQLGPNVSAVEPNAGSWRAPRTVEVRGRFFVGAPITAVRFGGVAATDVVVVGDTTIRCTVPAGAPGPVDIEVENPIATTTLPGGYVYTPGLVAPATVAPGASLTIDHRLERAGDFVVALVGQPGGPGGTIPGIDRERTIGDPTVLFLAPFWPADRLPLTIPVPDLPSLVGVEAAFQAVSGTPGRATWTNAVTVRVAR